MTVDKYTVSLLTFEDGLKDLKGKTWTFHGATEAPIIRDFEGRTALFLNGQQQYLEGVNSNDFDFGKDDFTIDWWECRGSASELMAVFASDTMLNSGILVGDAVNGNISSWLSASGTGWDIASNQSMGKIILNQWVHYALVRNGSSFYTFQNGKLQSTWQSTAPVLVGRGNPVIGRNGDSYYFNGYIDDFRISKGIARWTADFEPGANTPVQPGALTLQAVGQKQAVQLSWNLLSGVDAYIVKRSTSSGGPYNVVGTPGNIGAYVDNTVQVGTKYYYQVVAMNGKNEVTVSNEVTILLNPGDTPADARQFLRVTMSDSSEREYRLPEQQVTGFVQWMNQRSAATPASYALSKFDSQEYLLFDKIISFEVANRSKA